MRKVWLFGALVLTGCFGCDRLLAQLLHDRGEGGGGGTGGVPVADGGAGNSGAAPDGGGAGGQGGGPGIACGTLTLTDTITLAPAAAGQLYTRCQTLGPEAGWQVALSPTGDRLAARTGAGTVRLISTDSTALATLSAEMGEVTLWNAADGRMQRSFAGPPASGVDASASQLAFSSDGARLATSLGTVIDLGTGTTTSWLTGAPETFTLTVNPENLGFSRAGGGIPVLRFTAGDARLFLELDFQVGDSPTSTRLELVDPATGAATVLFSAFSRALLGYAVSPDGRFAAQGTTEEAGAAGLTVFDARTGTQLAFDPSLDR